MEGVSVDHSSVDGQQSQSVRDELAVAQHQDDAATSQLTPATQQSSRKPAKCRFFATKKGCRAGDACPYLHVSSAERNLAAPGRQSVPQSRRNTSTKGKARSEDPVQDVAAGMANLSTDNSPPAPSPSATPNTRAVQRPVSKAQSQNPREFQLNQLRRRFCPNEETDSVKTSLTFKMAPSDPDFPFELEELHCVLHVPLTYPTKGRPTLEITNTEMDRVYQENVERGFDDIVDTSLRNHGQATLLGWMNSLDKHLERFLSTTERGPTLKFIANVNNKATAVPMEPAPSRVPSTQSKADKRPASSSGLLPAPFNPRPKYTAEQLAQAEKRRRDETRQLEARLGRLPLFQKSSDGISFTVPIQPIKIDRLSVPLRSVKAAKLLVPLLYPLEDAAVELQGVEKTAARPVERAFEQWVKENSNLNLMSQVNYLASNMHIFANKPLLEEPSEAPFEQDMPQDFHTTEDQPEPMMREPLQEMDHKSHIHVIPRPPEWAAPDEGSDEELTDISTSEEEFSDEGDESGGVPIPDSAAEKEIGRGVALSFPYLELYGIELLELVNLYITIKCERCKEQMDVDNIRQVKDANGTYAPKVEVCKKCTNTMSIGFRQQLIHQSSNRAGYLDLDGCAVVDLLPSLFIPTCAECSTPYPAPGVTAVRGESAMAVCRHCHRKMVFKIVEVKFLLVGSAAFTARAVPLRRKKPKETLGIVAGQELPRRGRCVHYGKSYRWFRFSCCSKVFPCDKCHDAATDHPNEHANRMICGFCSREQIYRPENCGICRAVLVGKAGSGFWEGGKGTRNKVLMSRKDPRKYKRRGGTKPGGSSSKRKGEAK